MKHSLKEPIPELFRSWELMTAAVDSHLAGDAMRAAERFHKANDPILWGWLYPEWEKCQLNVIEKCPSGDTKIILKSDRDPKRALSPGEKTRLLQRDGYRCRYCGIPVIGMDVYRAAHRFYPEAVPWDSNDHRKRHQGFQAMWLQFDHVVPHSHGGASNEENSVVCCALCNFGKDKYTLLQLGLDDPRKREPVRVDWDGLERLLSGSKHPSKAMPKIDIPAPSATRRASGFKPESVQAFFFPGAWVSSGYVYTPVVSGKERWFQISLTVQAEEMKRGEVQGVRLTCDPQLLVRRGISPAEFSDPGDSELA